VAAGVEDAVVLALELELLLPQAASGQPTKSKISVHTRRGLMATAKR
jgi:hypothetical protein